MAPPQQRRHYSKAPIVEAVIDIQVQLPTDGSALASLTSVADSLAPDFPNKLPIHEFHMGLVANTGGANFSNHQQSLGWRLDSSNRVVQLRLNGFSYSHLPPYSNWVQFSTEAEELWNSYVRQLRPEKVKRIAVRVINKVPITDQDAELPLSEVLNIYPNIPDRLPSNLRSMFVQAQLRMPEIDPDALLVLGLYNAPDSPDLMLDIDLFVQRIISVDDDVFAVLNKIGDAKDDVFEACITDLIRERIQ